jgi:hypothetical protein
MLVGPKLFRSCTGRTQVYFGSCTTNDPRLFWVLQHAKPKDSWVLMQPQRHVCAGVCPAHALGLLRTQVDSPSIQGWADRVSGGCSLGRGKRAWPRCPQPRGVRLQPGIWGLLAATSHVPHQTMQFILKLFTVAALQCRTIQFTMNSLIVHSSPRYSETLISSSYN